MNPGPARILTCPHCGGKKEVFTLLSGNTFDLILWSDNKRETSMLPSVSFVQQCLHCGGYYMMSRQKDKKYGKECSFELGNLNYRQHVEAWSQLSQLPDLTDDERQSCLLHQVWAYNDMFTRHDGCEKPGEEDVAHINMVVDELVKYNDLQCVFKAELLREVGRYDEAVQMLDNETDSDEFLQSIIAKIRERIAARDSRPFVLNR